MLFYLVAVVFHQLKDKSSVHERQQVVEEERQADVDFLCLLYLLKQQQIKKHQSVARLGRSCRSSSCELFDTTEANIISPSNSLMFGGHWHNPGKQEVNRDSGEFTLVYLRYWWAKWITTIRCHRYHIPHLMLLYKDGPNLRCNHGDNGGDVIFKSVREAASSRDVVLVEMRHMLSHAFHLFK